MTADGKAAKRKSASLKARNKKKALDYIDALRRGDRAAIDAALSPNFRFVRLNDRLSRYEYLDSLGRTLLSGGPRRLDVLYAAADGDRVFIELALEFEFEGSRVTGQYNSVYIFEDGEIYEIREYGGIA